MNNVNVIGNVGRDPELRMSAVGMAVARFGVATTYGKDDDRKTEWFNVVVFGEMAERVCEEVTSGTRVMVVGRLQTDEYKGKDGEQRRKTELIATEVGVSLRWAKRSSVTREKVAQVEEAPF